MGSHIHVSSEPIWRIMHQYELGHRLGIVETGRILPHLELEDITAFQTAAKKWAMEEESILNYGVEVSSPEIRENRKQGVYHIFVNLSVAHFGPVEFSQCPVVVPFVSREALEQYAKETKHNLFVIAENIQWNMYLVGKKDQILTGVDFGLSHRYNGFAGTTFYNYQKLMQDHENDPQWIMWK